MKITIQAPKEIEPIFIEMFLPVRYEEEDIPNDFPLRHNDIWTAKVRIDTGEIVGWPKGKSGKLQMKVCDSGRYRLLDNTDRELAERCDYVPGCVPGEWGDYVRFEINEDGIIKDWKSKCDGEAIADAFFPEE